jgi:hypothetical protein
MSNGSTLYIEPTSTPGHPRKWAMHNLDHESISVILEALRVSATVDEIQLQQNNLSELIRAEIASNHIKARQIIHLLSISDEQNG